MFSHNHDQVGNRAFGDRLCNYVTFDELKLAAGVTILSPYLPLLFMGEEYSEPAPFLYFIDFDAGDVVEGVRSGRKDEFAPFVDDGEDPPDPQSYSTFFRSKLNFPLRQHKHHQTVWRFYQRLMELRKTLPALRHLSKEQMEVAVDDAGHLMTVRRWHDDHQAIGLYNFHSEAVSTALPEGAWTLCLDSNADEWAKDGAGQPATLDHDQQMVTISPKGFVLLTLAGERS